MSGFYVSTAETHTSNKGIFSLMPNRTKKWIIFDTIEYQKPLNYQISFPLFKVGEPWKFQVSGFCISTGDIHTSEKGIFLSFQTEWELPKLAIFDKIAYLNMAFKNIDLLSHYSESVSR